MNLFIAPLCLLLVSLVLGENSAPLKVFDDGNSQFSGQFLNQVVDLQPKENVIMSAYSVLFPLAQLSLAATGETRNEITSALRLPAGDTELTKNAFTAAAQQIENVKGVVLKSASKVYVAKDARLKSDFAKVSKDVFNSEVENVNFEENVQTAKVINKWVESKTNDRIKDLVDPKLLDGSTRLVLVNAIYFKGLWKEPFKKELTSNRDFHVTATKTQKVPMMNKQDTVKYGESAKLNAKLLELPYNGDETSLLVVLPNEIDGLNSLVKKLEDPKNLEEAVSNMRNEDVIIYLPKFKIETKTNLKDVLIKMGVKKLFTPGAELGNLIEGPDNVYVSDAIQKAFVEVNEEGTEASAANAFIVRTRSGRIHRPLEFNADKPFFYAIVHKPTVSTKTALFTGIFKA